MKGRALFKRRSGTGKRTYRCVACLRTARSGLETPIPLCPCGAGAMTLHTPTPKDKGRGKSKKRHGID